MSTPSSLDVKLFYCTSACRFSQPYHLSKYNDYLHTTWAKFKYFWNLKVPDDGWPLVLYKRVGLWVREGVCDSGCSPAETVSPVARLQAPTTPFLTSLYLEFCVTVKLDPELHCWRPAMLTSKCIQIFLNRTWGRTSERGAWTTKPLNSQWIASHPHTDTTTDSGTRSLHWGQDLLKMLCVPCCWPSNPQVWSSSEHLWAGGIMVMLTSF